MAGLNGVPRFEVIGLRLPEVKPGDNLAGLIVDAAEKYAGGLRDGDVVVVASKLVLKARGLMYRLSDVRPSLAARLIARVTGKNPVEVELILRASRDIIAAVEVGWLRRFLDRIAAERESAERVLSKIPSIIFVATRQGLVAMDGGVDYSNLPPGYAIANTVDFDAEARRLRAEIERLAGRRVAVVITDTETNTSGKVGTVDVAVGSSGIRPVARGFGSRDIYGRPKFGGVDIVVDEVAAAAALVMGQTSEGVPAAIVRGLRYEASDEGVASYAIGFRGLGLRLLLKNLLIRLIYRVFWRPSRQL
jgi:coenzyme F420-0:L-glutamate ligase/coenzyme F420-1:gamma-L-glutamate ligase